MRKEDMSRKVIFNKLLQSKLCFKFFSCFGVVTLNTLPNSRGLKFLIRKSNIVGWDCQKKEITSNVHLFFELNETFQYQFSNNFTNL